MSNSPNKFVGAAARATSGGRTNFSGIGARLDTTDMFGIFGGINPGSYKSKARRQERRLERDKAKKLQEAGISRNQKMFADLTARQYMASGEVPGSVVSATEPIVRSADELSSAIPDVEANNTIDNTTSSAPVAPAQPLAPVQPQTPTFGVAGMGVQMFGTPEERQVSMGSSLMKRACKYKNKK